MPNIELGTFLAFLVIPFASFIFIPALKRLGFFGWIIFIGIGIVGFIMLGGTALVFFSQYDVVLTTHVPEISASGTSEVRDSIGDLVSTTNKTATVAAYDEVAPVINDFHNEFGWLMFGFTIVFGLIYFKVLAEGLT